PAAREAPCADETAARRNGATSFRFARAACSAAGQRTCGADLCWLTTSGRVNKRESMSDAPKQRWIELLIGLAVTISAAVASTATACNLAPEPERELVTHVE